MVDGVERERLREGHQTSAPDDGRRRGRPAGLAQAGGAEIFMVRDFRFGLVTGDVLCKKYIMLTKFYFVRT
jgi:hypothetical protein